MALDGDDLDLADITIRKDAVIAAYQALVARWEGVQGAGMGRQALPSRPTRATASRSDKLSSSPAFAGTLVALANVAIQFHGRSYARSIRALRDDIKSLKRRRDS